MQKRVSPCSSHRDERGAGKLCVAPRATTGVKASIPVADVSVRADANADIEYQYGIQTPLSVSVTGWDYPGRPRCYHGEGQFPVGDINGTNPRC